LGVNAKTAQKPSARSGFQFECHAAKNTVFLYGGYSKVSMSSTSERGRNLDDMWALHLTAPAKAGMPPTFQWEPVVKKGTPPSRRSGAASCVHKNRLIMFGGVLDTETTNDVEGQFFNSIHAFDMDRLKWFALNISADKKKKKGGKKRRNKTGVSVVSSSESYQSLEDDEDDDGPTDKGKGKQDDNDDDEDDYGDDDYGLDDNAFYVIIDGKLTKIEVDDEEEEEEEAPQTGSEDAATPKLGAPSEPLAPVPEAAEAPEPPAETDAAEADAAQDAAVDEDDEAVAPVPPPSTDDGDEANEEGEREGTGAAKEGAGEEEEEEGEVAPMPRIGAGLATLGSKLFVFGGTTEIGERQVTFDDLWSIDLNKMESWVNHFEGTWKNQAWQGNDDGEDGDDDDDEEDDEDDEDDEEDEEEEDDEEGDEGDEEGNVNEMSPKERAERVKKLRETLQLGDEARTPLPREPLRDFFRRTRDTWMRQAFENRESDERLSGKEVRRLGFRAAEARFRELYPVLQELDELEEEQRLAEEMQEQEKQRIKDKLREKAKKRKAQLVKMAKKEKKDREKKEKKKKAAGGGSDDEDSEDED